MPASTTLTAALRLAGHDDDFIDDLEATGAPASITSNTALTPAQIEAIEAAYKAERQREEGP